MDSLGKNVEYGNGVPTLSLWMGERCKNEGLSYRKVAAMAGISHATVADIIKGARPSATTIMKLATAFGGNGHQRMALEDILLGLCGYKSMNSAFISEPLGRLLDKVKHFDESQIEVIEHFVDFVAKVGG